jgi:DNA polymerase III delta' subunit
MALKDFKGNENIVERMIRSVRNRSISHAYLLEGDRSVDKLGLAESFVKAILCKEGNGDCCDSCTTCRKISHGNHEDLIYLEADGSSIKDEAIEELQGRIKKKPYDGERNIVILKDADTMTLRAQNRLLKTLEEPTPGTVIILLSENTENLAQTILSRCVIFKLKTFETQEYKNVLEGAILIAGMLLEGRPFYEISGKLSEFTANRNLAHELLDAMETWYRDLAIYRYDSKLQLIVHRDKMDEIRDKSRLCPASLVEKAVGALEEARSDLNRNLNVSYTLKNMILKITL